MPRQSWQTAYQHRLILGLQSGRNSGRLDPVDVRKRLYALLDAPDVEEQGLPGCVITQYRRCRYPRCRCQAGLLHDPYYFWYVRMFGVVCKRYLRRDDAPRVSALCQRRRERHWTRARSRTLIRDYKRHLRELDRWLDAASRGRER